MLQDAAFICLNEPYIHENGRKTFLTLLENITKIHTDSEKRIFTLEWQCIRDYGKDVMTEVYVPKKGILKYPNVQGNNKITVKY